MHLSLDRMRVIELNPWAPTTDAGLFAWTSADDARVLNGERPFEVWRGSQRCLWQSIISRRQIVKLIFKVGYRAILLHHIFYCKAKLWESTASTT
jgi:hypothetical protein